MIPCMMLRESDRIRRSAASSDFVQGTHSPHDCAGFVNALGLLRSPRQVLFGAGQRYALGGLAAELGSRAFVCTDARFGDSPEFAELVDLMKRHGMHVAAFTEVLPDAPTA